jgi:CHAT domain-containing protein
LLVLGDPTMERPGQPPAFAPLPGTRREVEAVAGLFGRATRLLGSEASEQRLEQLAASGELSRVSHLHLATHAVIHPLVPERSALILAQDGLPDPVQQVLAGRPVYEGRLTVGRILDTWKGKLNADLVTLSACGTGLGRSAGGEGFLGFSQALLLAGARSVVLSLWPVDDQATALLMQRFYQNLLGRRDGLKEPLPKAEALGEAKAWLRGLTADQIDQHVARLPKLERGGERKRDVASPDPQRPYAHPYYWSAFILIGDPD